MWSAAIVFFIGTLLLIGLGIIDPVKDNNHPDPVVITGIFTALSYRVYLHTERKSYASNLGKITSKPFNPQIIILNVRIPPKGLYCREGLILHLPVQSLRKQQKPDILKRSGPIIAGKGQRLFLPICVVEYIAAIILNIPNTNRRLFGSSATDSSPMSNLTHYLNKPVSDSPGRTGGICPSLTMPEKSTSFFISDKKLRVLSSFLASLSFWLVMHFVLHHLAIFDFFNFIFLFFIAGNQQVTCKVVAES